jgi:GTP 3',8-cyclase
LRPIDTLRVSITDRCNLRCIYCMPPEGVRLIPHDEILSFEEIERVARTAVRAGARKVRITGGEPLVRKGVTGLIERLSRIRDIYDLPMTTNGILLSKMARDLKAAGLSRVTVSLDTLRAARFESIAGRPELHRVRMGLDAAIAAGLLPLKVNVVVVPGRNDDEALDFAALAMALDLEVRFIERMPLGRWPDCGLAADSYVPSGLIRQQIDEALGPLEPVNDPLDRPAKVYSLPGGRGRIGFISPLTEPFCRHCSRMRLTPDGRLRACLAQELELDVKGPMRRGIDDEGLSALFVQAVDMKPVQDSACFGGERMMSQIGG